MVEGDAIYVDGIGHIGQYYSYLNCRWEKGLPYFVRDCYTTDKNLKADSALLNQLNSDIIAYEKSLGNVKMG